MFALITYRMRAFCASVMSKTVLCLQGGFAKCYEMVDQKSQKIYAGKIIAKNRLSKPHQKEKV